MTEFEEIMGKQFGVPPLEKKVCRYRGFTPCLGDACQDFREISMSGAPPGGKSQEFVGRVCKDDFVAVKMVLLGVVVDRIEKAVLRLSLTSGVSMNLPRNLRQ
jgi:hypothetical protein